MQSIGFFFIATTSGMIDATKAIPIVAAKSIATSFTPKLNNETFRVVCANVELNIAHPIQIDRRFYERVDRETYQRRNDT